MNNPNPLAPQGSQLEQTAKRKPTLPIVVFVFLAIHAVVLGGILMSGCKPDSAKTDNAKAKVPDDHGIPPMTNTAPPEYLTPVPAVTPVPVATNPAITTVTPPAPVPAPAPLTPAPLTPAPLTPAPIPPSPLVTEPPAVAVKAHVIAKGDMFVTIAKKYGVTVAAIEKANPGVDPKKIKPGQKLVIPAKDATAKTAKKEGAPDNGAKAGEYVVKSGDNLGKIARDNGTTVKAIKDLNGMPTDQIKVGQKLKLPPATGKKPSGPAPAPANDGGLAVPAATPTPAPITPTPGNN